MHAIYAQQLVCPYSTRLCETICWFYLNPTLFVLRHTVDSLMHYETSCGMLFLVHNYVFVSQAPIQLVSIHNGFKHNNRHDNR